LNNILVTGSKGFIGQNLLKQLKDQNVLEFNRGDSIEKLEELVLQSDFIYHFAGEVRPDSSDNAFTESNITLTQKLIEILEKNNRIIPILFTSSIHAKLLKNEYGKTKRESELLIESYAKKNNANCYIYVLPHVFGEGCKANYNSVISTWIYNSIKNLEINVFDKSIEMNYVYIQDIVEEFIDMLNEKNSSLYLKPLKIYKTNLGSIIEYIEEFKHNINKLEYLVTNNQFKEKLFNTYRWYVSKYDNN
jgi:UDP-2-acetamido-2,6-beta-L-arabino-hexul-4-ose reductase